MNRWVQNAAHRFLTIAVLLILLLCGQAWASEELDSSEEHDALVLLDETEFEIINQKRSILKVHRVIQVNNEQGSKKYGHVIVLENKFQKCKKLKAMLLDESNEVVKKVQKKDLSPQNVTASYALYRDSDYLFKSLVWGAYPHYLDIKYELVMRSLFFWPQWDPQEDVPVKRSTYTLKSDGKVQYSTHSIGFDPDSVLEHSEDGKTLTWTLVDIEPRHIESRMPAEDKNQLNLIFAPDQFELGASSGSCATWGSFADWYRELSSERTALPADALEEISVVAGESLAVESKDMRQRVRDLYSYMQTETRYVAVELGIGGWQPHTASSVFSNKYGDCKDLTNYMIAMLETSGITAYPALIRTRNQGAIIRDLPGSQFNHVICCIPAEPDTFWLECTADHLAAGELPYRDEDCETLLITESGSALVRTPQRSATENLLSSNFQVTITSAGRSSVEGHVSAFGNRANYIRRELIARDEEERSQWLQTYFGEYSSSFTLRNFMLQNVDQHFEKPIAMEFEATISKSANASRKRLMVNPNMFNRRDRSSVPDDEERIFPYDFNYPYSNQDSLSLVLPDGYHLEAAPLPQDIVTSFGHYRTEYHFDGGVLTYRRSFQIDATRIPPEEYEAYRSFTRAASKNDGSLFVFAK